MTNRLVLGNARSTSGMWVSKPTEDVLSCDDDQLLFSTNQGDLFLQVLAKGNILLSGIPQSINVPSAGSGDYLGVFWYPSSTSSSIRSRDNISYDDAHVVVTQTFPSSNTTRVSFVVNDSGSAIRVYYIITNMRV